MAMTLSSRGITYSNGSLQYSSGKVINFQRITYGTRNSFGDTSGAAGNTFWSTAYTKLSATSNLYLEVDLAMRNNYSDHLIHEANYAGGTWFQGTQPYDAGFSANSRPYHSTFYITGNTSTGSNNISIRYRCTTNASGERPAGNVWNPSSADDARYSQEYSSINVYEIQG
jgi:hypothetical protein